MTDWAAISSVATAGGTFVLAIVTLASVRSSNRSARVAEVALQEQRRPVLMPSRIDDPTLKIMFIDQHWVQVPGGHGVAEQVNNTIYFSLSLRNVGLGIGVAQGWFARTGIPGADVPHAEPGQLRSQSRDLYIPGGNVGLWQGALRDPNEGTFVEMARAIAEREPITIGLLYTDQVGGQRTITRFLITSAPDASWVESSGRVWYLDAAGPR